MKQRKWATNWLNMRRKKSGAQLFRAQSIRSQFDESLMEFGSAEHRKWANSLMGSPVSVLAVVVRRKSYGVVLSSVLIDTDSFQDALREQGSGATLDISSIRHSVAFSLN
jgi:hypothetical protein